MAPEKYTKRVKGNKSTVCLYFIPKKQIVFVLQNMRTFSFQSIGIYIVEISDRLK